MFDFVDSSESTKYRASIQVTGRCSFGTDAAKFMELGFGPGEKQFFKVAFDKKGPDFTKIFLVESEETPITAKVFRSGMYYYLRLEKPLTKFGIDYKSKAFIFTIEKQDEQFEGKDVFVLNKYKVTDRDPEDFDEGEDGPEEE